VLDWTARRTDDALPVIFRGVPVCGLDEAISELPAEVELLVEPSLTVGLGLWLAVGLLDGLVFTELSAVCLKTKYAAIPTNATSNNTIATTPAVKMGFDARASLGAGRKSPAFG
jgi:hypothetical protein